MAKRLAWTGLLALVLAVVAVAPALAQQLQPGKLILGGSFTLEQGQRLDGGLAVVGGQVRLSQGSRVDGDVIVTGGTLEVAGAVNGDITVLGGAVSLADTARVNGDVVMFGGEVERAPGAVVTGAVRPGGTDLDFPWLSPFAPSVRFSNGPQVGPEAFLQWLLRQLLRLVQALALSLAFGALALMLAAVWPQGIERTGRTEIEQPLLAFAVGLLTWLLALGLALLMVVTLCLIPVALVLGVLMVVVAALAWIATGWVVGHKLAGLVGARTSSPAVEASVGTMLVLLVYFGTSWLWCAQFVYGLVVLFLGTGALVLTRFGSQPYPPTLPAPPSPAEPPAGRAVSVPPAAQPPHHRSGQDLGLPPDAAQRVVNDPASTPGMRSGREIGLPPDADDRLLGR